MPSHDFIEYEMSGHNLRKVGVSMRDSIKCRICPIFELPSFDLFLCHTNSDPFQVLVLLHCLFVLMYYLSIGNAIHRINMCMEDRTNSRHFKGNEVYSIRASHKNSNNCKKSIK